MERFIANVALGETITFVETESEAQGRHSQLLVTLEPGGGTPLHFHNSYDETFTALHGRLGLRLADSREIFLRPGESYTVPRGEVHRLFNGDAGQIRFLNVVSPGHAGFEKTLRIMAGLASDGEYNVLKRRSASVGRPRTLRDDE